MKLFIVQSTGAYDDYDSHVVSAESPEAAVELIASAGCRRLPGNPKSWQITEIGVYNGERSEIIHSSFISGE